MFRQGPRSCQRVHGCRYDRRKRSLSCSLVTIELRRFHDSHRIFTTLLAAYPGCEAAKKELNRTEDRLREQDYGAFKFLMMHEAAAEDPSPTLNVATYDRSVTIKMTEVRGRGLFTTQKAAAGDLLLCEKAFSLSYLENTSTTSLESVVALKEPVADLATFTVHQLQRNHSQIPSVMSLHTSPSRKHNWIECQPSMSMRTASSHNILYDTNLLHWLLISRILHLNAFKNSSTSLLRSITTLSY